MAQERFKTGQISSFKSEYKWDGYTDRTNSPSQTAKEERIELDAGEVFPPINSCDKGAYWLVV